MANDIIDINVYETVETVAITVNPNLTTVNINRQVPVGVNGQDLQSVTDIGATTTNGITITVGDGGGDGISSTSSQGFGVYGSSSETYGVYGSSPSSAGVYGIGGIGVYGESTNGNGVEGVSADGNAIYGNSANVIGVYARSDYGTGLYGYTEDGVAIFVQSNAIGLEVNGNGTIAIEANLGNSNKGVVINSGASSTGNPIEIVKENTTKLSVNQQGELTATKLIKQGGTSSQFLMADGSVSTGGGGGGATNLSTTQTANNFTINSDTGDDAVVPLGNGTLAGATLNDYTTAEKNKLSGIATGAEVNVNADWNAVSGDAQILNKPTIPSITNLVPYTGANNNVDLGLNDIIATKLIKQDGTSSQILAADGSVITAGTNITITGGTISSASGGISNSVASGTDTYTTTISGVASYVDGAAYLIRFTNGNTTGATLNINGLGAIALYRNNDGALIGGDIQNGGEMLCVYNSTITAFQCIGTSPNDIVSYVTNADSVTITKGMPVYAFGGTGDRMTVKRAYNTLDATSAQTVGLVMSTSIAAGQKGLIITQGLLYGLSTLPTSTFADGDTIYLGATAGTITNVKPHAPNHLVYLGVVTTASAGAAGRMYVKVQNGYELDELHNVQAQNPTLKDTLWYDNTVSPAQWKTASIPTILGYTPYNATNPSGYQTSAQVQTIADAKVVQTITNGVTATAPSQDAVFDALASKQDTLQSTVNIKSINGNSILGSGDLTISASPASQSAFTILANNTNATALPTEQPFENLTNQVYSGTIVWSGGAAPSGTTSHTYSLSQVGNLVTLTINLAYGSAGASSLTNVTIELPSTAPQPAAPSSVTNVGDILSFVNGNITITKLIPASNAVSILRLKSTAPNIFEISISRSANSYRYAYATIQYFV